MYIFNVNSQFSHYEFSLIKVIPTNYSFNPQEYWELKCFQYTFSMHG